MFLLLFFLPMLCCFKLFFLFMFAQVNLIRSRLEWEFEFSKYVFRDFRSRFEFYIFSEPGTFFDSFDQVVFFGYCQVCIEISLVEPWTAHLAFTFWASRASRSRKIRQLWINEHYCYICDWWLKKIARSRVII